MPAAEVNAKARLALSEITTSIVKTVAMLENHPKLCNDASVQARGRAQKRERESEEPAVRAGMPPTETGVKRGKRAQESDSKRYQENVEPAASGRIGEPVTRNEITLPPYRMVHICHGDKTGGGHMYSSRRVTSKFPSDWKFSDIINSVQAVAKQPQGILLGESRKAEHDRVWAYYGERRGQAITVIVADPSNEIVTAYPGRPRLPR